MVLGKLDSYKQRKKLDHSLTAYTKINSKWINDLDVREEFIKILEENIGCNLYDIGQSNIFHDTSPKPRETKDKMNLRDFINVKSFCTAKETVKKLRGSPRNGRRYLQITLQIKDWYPRSTKNFSNSTHEKQINITKWAEDMNRHFSNEDIQMLTDT